jgi:hypothetical protein
LAISNQQLAKELRAAVDEIAFLPVEANSRSLAPLVMTIFGSAEIVQATGKTPSVEAALEYVFPAVQVGRLQRQPTFGVRTKSRALDYRSARPESGPPSLKMTNH